ncbi:hypothetical protein SPBRAN_679 [uncultured Candidatus Thioglobus sp.]|nr:hypothetical protein SPBRAN_679 [uncultured Candidatus Thioglobus sp.]
MKNKILLVFGVLMSQLSLAFIPALPSLPMFGDFDPNKLRVDFNQFIGVEPDFAREARMVDQIADAVLDGDVEYLATKSGKEVFSIYMESEADKPKGGVIILHNRGQHANWADTIKPLRIGLTEKGWNTLSVQMPVLDKNAKYYDYVPIFPYAHERIEAAIDFYKKQGIDNIILITHGCGAHMAMSYIDKYGDSNINAFVGIGMGATDYKQKLVNSFPLYKMLVPVLDIYAQKDFSGVIRLAEYRADLLKVANNPKSKQETVDDADHYYKNNNSVERLTNQVGSWLDSL